MSDSATNQKIESLLQQAKDSLFSRDYERTEKFLKQCIALDSDNLQVLLLMGKMYVSSAQDMKALETYTKILHLDKSNFDAMDNLGGILRRLGRYEESVEILKKAFSIYDGSVAIYYNLGQTYKTMERNDDAIDCFEKVLSVNPEDVLAYNHLGCIYAQQNRHQEALNVFKKALLVDQNHPIIHFNSARSYEAIDDTLNALLSYENAIRKKPGWIDAMKSYARLLFNCDKIDDAENILKQALQLKPQDAELHTMRGKLLAAQDKRQEALTEYEKALSLDDRNLSAFSGKLAVLEKEQRFQEAYDFMKKMNKYVDGSNEKLTVQCAQFLINMGSYGEAAEQLKIVLDKNPNHPDALCLLGEYFLMKGEETRALHCYDRAIKMKAENVQYRFDAARHLLDAGRFEAAEMQMRYYLSARPNDTDAWIYLGIVYTELDEIDNAIKVFRKALMLDDSNPALLAAVTKLDKNNPNTPNVQILLKEILGEHAGDTDNLGDLEESLKAYEQSLSQMSTNDDVEKNLRLLADENEEPVYEFYNEPLYQEIPIEDESIFNETEEEIQLESETEDEDSLEEEDFISLGGEFKDLKDASAEEDTKPIDFDIEEESVSTEDEFEDLVLESGEDVPIDPDFDDVTPQRNPFNGNTGRNPTDDILEEEETFDFSPKTKEQPQQNKDENVPSPYPQPPVQYPPFQYPPVQYPPMQYQQPPELPNFEPPRYEPPKYEPPKQKPQPPKFSPLDYVPPKTSSLDEFFNKLAKKSEPEPEPQKPAMSLRDQLRQEIRNALNKLHEQSQTQHSKKNDKIAEMFKYMRGLCNYLPQPKKMLFMTSENRVQLEYVINKLGGKPGLLNEATAVIKTIEEHEKTQPETFVKRSTEDAELKNVKVNVKVKPSSDDINETLLYMKDLTQNITDKELANALDSKILKLLNRCDSENLKI